MKNVQCNNSIDVVKGGLISLVVIGHFLLGTLEGNFVRYYIYSFHMPMFIFISGFLIKREKIRSRSYKAFITHYAKRMLGWWAVAWCFYTGLSLIKDFDLNKIGHFLLEPYYHLWYVPTLFCMICIVYMLQKMFVKNSRLFWLSLITISVLCKFVNWPSVSNLGHMIYFTLGVICGNISFNIVKIGGGKCWILYTIFIALVYALPLRQNVLYPYWTIPVTLSLILFWLYPNLKEDKLPKSPVLAYWGRNSLQIYLWHVFPIAILKNLFDYSPVLYYVGIALLSAWFCITSYTIIHKKQI